MVKIGNVTITEDFENPSVYYVHHNGVPLKFVWDVIDDPLGINVFHEDKLIDTFPKTGLVHDQIAEWVETNIPF